jgi:repressor LexA
MTKNADKKLTDKQSNILEFIKKNTKESGFPPSVREIGENFGITVKGAYDHIKAIEKKGFITTQQNKSRAIVVVDKDEEISAESITIPLLGRIAAGAPIFAQENVENQLSFPKAMFSSGEYFALSIKGDSMIEAGIFDNDIAIIRKQSSADNGDIIAALLDDEATLKTLNKTKGKIFLNPENKAYKPIEANNVTVLGKLAAVFRKY